MTTGLHVLAQVLNWRTLAVGEPLLQEGLGMNCDFDNVIDRTNTDCYKWDARERVFGLGDVLPMWVADMDFPSPRPVIEAIIRRAQHGVFGYPLRPASLVEAIVEWFERRHGWKIESDWLVFAPGVVPALSFSLMAFSHPGDRVIIQPPVYHPFAHIIDNSGRKVVNNQLALRDGRYVMDYDDLERRFDPRTKLMILCSPHNPVGRVWSAEELTRLGELCLKRDVLVLADEIHCDLLFKGVKHTPFASLSEEFAQDSLTFIAPSKTFNLAGLTTSAVVIPNARLRAGFTAVVERLGLGFSNLIGLVTWEAACREGEGWLDELLEYVQGNLDFLVRYVEDRIPKMRVIRPEGTYMVWLDCRDLGVDPGCLKEFMVRKARVGLNDGAMFGPGGAGFQRMNLACPRSIVAEGLQRIEAAVNSIQA